MTSTIIDTDILGRSTHIECHAPTLIPITVNPRESFAQAIRAVGASYGLTPRQIAHLIDPEKSCGTEER